MTEPNQKVDIFEGDFKLVRRDETIELTGKVYFDWFPSIGVKWEGEVNTQKGFVPKTSGGKYRLETDNFALEKSLLTGVSNSSSSGSTVKGIILSDADIVLGDQSVPVTKIKFTVPNLRCFHGTVVRTENGTASNRITLEDDKYLINLDKSTDFDSRFRDLKNRGGYINLYSGEVTAKDESIAFKDSREIMHCFSVFLSFLNGRMTMPLFLQGIHQEEIKWTDFTYYRLLDQYKSVNTWPQKSSIEGLSELWKNFYHFWRDEGDRDVLVMATHWYTEANSGSIITEGGIIMAQTCLELLYNRLIIEDKKLLIGRDSESISASNKIRLLVSQLQVTTEVPDAFDSLKFFVEKNNKIDDDVEAFVQIRNAIIHSQKKKRIKLIEIDEQIKYEALQLAIWYIELSLLYILDFQGKYYNRCSREIAAGAGEEFVLYL